jgi:parallel beta-helix repeat protein
MSLAAIQTGLNNNNLNNILICTEEDNLKESYTPSGRIVIDLEDSDSDNDWDDAPCTGAGVPGNPYIIEDLEIDCAGTGSGITIIHSDAYFIIRDCLIYDSSSSGNYAGIDLRDVENGRIIRNNISYNQGYGICLTWYAERHVQASPPYIYYTYDACKNIEIYDNDIDHNDKSGIYLLGYNTETYPIEYINITGNRIGSNVDHGIYTDKANNNTIIDNDCNNNYDHGMYLLDSNFNSIEENTCNNNNDDGMRLSSSDGNTVFNNTITGNEDVGIMLYNCDDIKSEWNNNLTYNTVSTNNIGIQLYSSDYNHVGLGNIVTGNTQYGIYLSEASTSNLLTGNTVHSNGVHNICYESDSAYNTFLNNGVTAVELGSPGSGGLPPPLGLEYLFSLLFVIFFIAVIGGIAYINRSKHKKLRENESRISYSTNQPRVTFIRPGVMYSEQPPEIVQTTSSPNYYEKDDNKPITPKEIEPYEFYCAKCDQKSLGYQVFCPTCGERMKQPKLASMHNPDEKIQCVICHTDTCATCNHDITGEDACYEECPYCERSYHKHCWNKTMQAFGKCGFCLETPPPELIPNAFKSQNDTHYQDP